MTEPKIVQSAQLGMPSASGLKPCPFCTGAAELSQGEYGDGKPWVYVECVECGAVAEPDLWNERYPVPAHTGSQGRDEALEPKYLLQRLRERIRQFDQAAMAFENSEYSRADARLDLDVVGGLTALQDEVERLRGLEHREQFLTKRLAERSTDLDTALSRVRELEAGLAMVLDVGLADEDGAATVESVLHRLLASSLSREGEEEQGVGQDQTGIKLQSDQAPSGLDGFAASIPSREDGSAS